MPEWLIENMATFVVLVILVSVFFWMFRYMGHQKKQAESRLDAIRATLGNFHGEDLTSGRLDALEYARNECKVPMAKRSWLEFDQTLIIADLGPGSGTGIRSSVPSSEYFNTETIAGELLHNRILNLAPGFFTAVGVLGTFLGLTVGLQGLEMGDNASTDQLRDGIHALIAGAATAFYTSLAGISVSLIANAIKGATERGMIRKIIKLQGEIDGKFPRYSPEQALANIAMSAETSSSSLQELHERIGEQFQKSVSGLADTMQKAVASAITTALAPAMNNLTDSMSEQSNMVFEELVGKFASSFESIGDNQAKQLNSASEELNRSVHLVAEEFSGMIAAASEQQVKNQEETAKSNANFQNQMTQLLTMADEQRSESSRTMEEIKRTLGTVSESLNSSSDKLTSVASSFAEASSKASGDMATISRELNAATSHVTTAAQHQNKALEQLAEHREQFMHLQQLLRELTIHLDNAVEKSSTTFGALGVQQDEFLEGLQNNVRQVNHSLSESVASLTSAMNKWLQEYAQSVSNHTAQRMDDWNLHSQDYARHMLQVASSLESVLDELPKVVR